MFNDLCIAQYMSIIIQQDATIYSLFVSSNCSTCFGWYLHPSSGARITVSTVSGIIETVTANCHQRDWTGTVPIQPRSRQVVVMVSLMPDTVDTVIRAPDDGWRYHPKHVEQFADINELYIVASCWRIIDTNSTLLTADIILSNIEYPAPTWWFSFPCSQ